MEDAELETSVGSVGDSYDNALAQMIDGLYPAEVSWRSVEAVEFDTLKWIDGFTHYRLLEPTGNITPAEAEMRYHAQRGHALAA